MSEVNVQNTVSEGSGFVFPISEEERNRILSKRFSAVTANLLLGVSAIFGGYVATQYGLSHEHSNNHQARVLADRLGNCLNHFPTNQEEITYEASVLGVPHQIAADCDGEIQATDDTLYVVRSNVEEDQTAAAYDANHFNYFNVGADTVAGGFIGGVGSLCLIVVSVMGANAYDYNHRYRQFKAAEAVATQTPPE